MIALLRGVKRPLIIYFGRCFASNLESFHFRYQCKLTEKRHVPGGLRLVTNVSCESSTPQCVWILKLINKSNIGFDLTGLLSILQRLNVLFIDTVELSAATIVSKPQEFSAKKMRTSLNEVAKKKPVNGVRKQNDTKSLARILVQSTTILMRRTKRLWSRRRQESINKQLCLLIFISIAPFSRTTTWRAPKHVGSAGPASDDRLQ